MVVPILLYVLVAVLSVVEGADFVDPNPITRIAFGSCANQNKDQPLWSAIARWDPDYFIWLGDAIYSDSRLMGMFHFRRPSLRHYSEQLHKMKIKPEYQSFSSRRTKILGVWDDHDYGVNDGGISDPLYTTAVQDMFLHFLDEPEDSPRWNRKGLYGSYLFGEGEHTIKLILLDPRSQIDREKGTVLGDEQWEWLDRELRSDPTPLTLIGTGLPVLTERLTVDKWVIYPQERERLLGLVSRRPNTIILSGDSHFGEIQCSNTTRGPLFEVTSSGMTHNCLDYVPVFLCEYGVKFVSECAGCIATPYVDLNYGTLQIQWTPQPRVIMEVRGRAGTEIHYVFSFDKTSVEHCPPPVKVEYQIVWQVVGISGLTIVLIIPFYLMIYIILGLYARISVYLKLRKDHQD